MQRTSQRQFEAWKQFYSLRPWGDDWHQTGVMASAAVNPHLPRGKAIKPDKLVPKSWFVRENSVPQTQAEIISVLTQAATNGQQRRKH
jgi:hypothetical protein